MAYTAIKSWDNGRRETQEFTDYSAMCQWLAEDPEAGIGAIETDEAGEQTYVDPLTLAEDVAYYA